MGRRQGPPCQGRNLQLAAAVAKVLARAPEIFDVRLVDNRMGAKLAVDGDGFRMIEPLKKAAGGRA